MPKSWIDEQLIEAVRTSSSITEVVLKLYENYAGSHTETVRKHAARLGLDLSHLNGRIGRKRTVNYFVKGDRSKRKIRNRFKEISKYECVWCGNPGIHRNEKLTLQLDHIDGDNSNNLIENLRWLCPNCHSQTPTYAKTKSKLITGEKSKKSKIEIDCTTCKTKYEVEKTRYESKKRKGQTNFYCSSKCIPYQTGINDLEMLKIYEETGSYLGTAKKLGISDVSVLKRIRNIKRRIEESNNGNSAGSGPVYLGSNPSSSAIINES